MRPKYDREKAERVYAGFVEAWRRNRGAVTVRGLAAALRLPKSTVHTYLGHLVETGRLVEQSPAVGGIGHRIVPRDTRAGVG